MSLPLFGQSPDVTFPELLGGKQCRDERRQHKPHIKPQEGRPENGMTQGMVDDGGREDTLVNA